MKKKTLTADEVKELRRYLDSMEKLEKEEPPHIKDVLPPEDYQRAADYLLLGKGEPPACINCFSVTEIADENGETHKAISDTAWEEWNAKIVKLNEKYNDLILKALSISFNANNSKPQDVEKIIKALLPPPGAPATGFYNVPDSAATDLIMEILSAGNNVVNLPAQKKYIAHGAKYEITAPAGSNSRNIAKISEKSEINISLSDVDKFLGSNKPAKKLFVLTLIKANEQAIFNGDLQKDYVTFPLQELIDTGAYKSLDSARKGFKKGAATLTSLKVNGHEERKNSKKTASKADVLEVLFTGARIINNQCYMFLNDRINWAFLAQFYTIIPSYYFKLSNRASDLLYYIFYLARQHTKDIAEKGYFTIGFRAIQSRLNLPNEIELHNTKREIKDPIEAAIEEIENENSAYFKNTDFSLLPVCDDTAPAADFLNNGYLRVSLKGQFAETFIQLCTDAEKKIETANKRREKIEDKAHAINLAKSLEVNTAAPDNKTEKK